MMYIKALKRLGPSGDLNALLVAASSTAKRNRTAAAWSATKKT